eukprot:1161535-Pelagomonas_calceolata.AAC.5
MLARTHTPNHSLSPSLLWCAHAGKNSRTNPLTHHIAADICLILAKTYLLTHSLHRGSSKLKDEAELEIDLTGAQESGVHPPAPAPPPQESFAQAQASSSDALSSSRQQGSQPPQVSFVPEDRMDSNLSQQQQELRTPGLDRSTGVFVGRGRNGINLA